MAYKNQREVELLRRKLIAIRKREKLTQENVADFCNVSIVTYQKYEAGRTIPNADFLISFQKLTGECPLPQLINFREVANNLTLADLFNLTKQKYIRRMELNRQLNHEYLESRGNTNVWFVKWISFTLVSLTLVVMAFSYIESVRLLFMQNTITQLAIVGIIVCLFIVEIYIGFDEIHYWRWRKQYLKKRMK